MGHSSDRALPRWLAREEVQWTCKVLGRWRNLSEHTRQSAANTHGPPADENAWGTGYIPKSCLLDWSRARGIANAIDTVKIRHVSGGISTLSFKSYEMGRAKWQGETLDGVWFDEEPPLDIYSEGLTRTQARRLFSILTFTPLQGASEVVRLFLNDASGDINAV